MFPMDKGGLLYLEKRNIGADTALKHMCIKSVKEALINAVCVVLLFESEGFPLKAIETGLVLQLFYKNLEYIKFSILGASLVAQWLRIHLPMQGTRVRALVQEDPTCHGATKPMHHNY